jgi:Ca2+-binding RTX toxin-like protein
MGKWKKGGSGPDSFEGSNRNDFYDGRGGPDTISGVGGNDNLKGGGGNDAILGGENNDKIWGAAGYDIISGDAGKDTLWGGADTDSFIFRTGGHFGIGSDIDIIKDVDTSGKDMDHIQIMSVDPTNLIDSFGDVMKHAHQSGKDVRLGFGHGDILILSHTKMAALSAELFMFEG